MSIVKCHECGSDVSDEASACPKCGAKTKKKAGLIGWIIALTFGAIVFQCNSPASTAPKAQKTAEQIKAEQQQKTRHAAAVASLSAIKKALRDPESAQWDDVRVSEDGSTVCISYRAKNGFGGYGNEFAVFHNGKPSQSDAEWNKRCAGKAMFDHKNARHYI